MKLKGDGGAKTEGEDEQQDEETHALQYLWQYLVRL